jgi:hypothetical protein
MTQVGLPLQTSTITVVTWPTLWLYWPVYLALARTERQFNYGIRFVLEPCRDDIVTDERIRNVFYQRAQKNEAVIALCEPGPEHNLEITYSDPYRRVQVMVRRLPVVWRQPHWLLWRGPSNNPPVGGTVWTYPIKTTSGDFVRTIFHTLPSLHDRSRFESLAQDMDEQRDRVDSLRPEKQLVASFTPWHLYLNARHDGLNREGAMEKLLRSRALPGPSREVTALLIPDINAIPDLKAYWNKIGGRSVIDAISRHLKNVLNELVETQADDELMSNFLAENCDLVNSFLNTEAWWLNGEFLRQVMCEYVRLGCYFPYRSIDSAISSEIRKRLRDRFDELKEQALVAIQTDMNDFLGSGSEWQDLSFRERLHVWKKAAPKDKRDLWLRLTHLSRTDLSNGLENILRSISVSTSGQQGRVPLLSLAPRLPLECSLRAEIDLFERLDKCQKERNGEVTPGQPINRELDCLICVVGGITRSLLRPAAVRLATAVDAPVAYSLGQPDNKVLFGTACPICVQDIQGLIDVFIRELRKPSASKSAPPCEIILFNGFNAHKPEVGGSILIGILWRGSTDAGKGNGNAKMGLRNWAEQQRNLGHMIEWLGFWLPDGSAVTVESNSSKSEHNSACSPYTIVADKARQYFASNDYTFAYIAVFRIEDTTGSSA